MANVYLQEKQQSKTKENYSALYGRMKSESTDDAEDMLPHKEMGQLSFEEKKFLLAVERGDVATTRRYNLTFSIRYSSFFSLADPPYSYNS